MNDFSHLRDVISVTGLGLNTYCLIAREETSHCDSIKEAGSFAHILKQPSASVVLLHHVDPFSNTYGLQLLRIWVLIISNPILIHNQVLRELHSSPNNVDAFPLSLIKACN